MMELSIIIPTRDRGAVFDETLRCALAAIAHIEAEIVVVNDSRILRPSIPEVAAVRMVDNPGKGVAAARNAGVRSTTGKLLLFLDDDIQISKTSIDHVLKLHREMDKVCVNLNWVYPPSLMQALRETQFGRFMIARRMISFKDWYNQPSWKDNALFASTSVASFHLSLKRTDFEKSKGYNEKFPHAGFEDHDFPLALKKAGLSFFIDSRVTVYHNEADRLDPDNWLGNWERRAATRKVAVDLGYKELTLKYSFFKKMILGTIGAGNGLIKGTMTALPNRELFDPIFFKLVGLLQAYRIYRGYTSN
jgi:glycosyltransferase involved in cell wall biosynthesis